METENLCKEFNNWVYERFITESLKNNDVKNLDQAINIYVKIPNFTPDLFFFGEHDVEALDELADNIYKTVKSFVYIMDFINKRIEELENE